MGSKDPDSLSVKQQVNKMVFEVTRQAILENKPILSDALMGNAGSDAPTDKDPKKQVFNVEMITTPNPQESLVLPPAGDPSSNVKQTKSLGDNEPNMSTDSSDIPGLSSSADRESSLDGKPIKGK